MPRRLEPRTLRKRGLHHLGVVVEERGRTRVVDEVGDLGRERPVADRHDQRTHPRDAVPDREQLGAVVQHHRHPVAGADAGAGEHVGDAVGVGVELGEAHPPIAGDERDPVRVLAGDSVDASGFHAENLRARPAAFQTSAAGVDVERGVGLGTPVTAAP